MTSQNLIHGINLLTLLLLVVSFSFVFFTRLRWKKVVLNPILILLCGIVLYFLASICNDTLFPSESRMLQVLPLLFTSLGHALFLRGTHQLRRLSAPIGTTNPAAVILCYLWYCSALFLPTNYSGLIALAPGIIYGLSMLLYLFKGGVKKSSEIDRWFKIMVVLSLLFMPFIGFDLFRYYTICTTLPTLTLYCGVFSCLLIKVTWLHWLCIEKEVEQVSLEEQLQSFSLTPRELDIVWALLQGKSNSAISDSLFISIKTVETHSRNIYRKIGVANRVELFAKIYKK